MEGFVRRFINFDKLIATTLIKILYWIGLVFIALGALAALFSGFAQGFGAGVAALVLVPVGAAVAVLFWRFLCEVYIVIFGIYDRLGEIRDRKAM